MFCEFVTRELPTLGADRPEAFLAALLENTPESMVHRTRVAFEAAVAQLPVAASRTQAAASRDDAKVIAPKGDARSDCMQSWFDPVSALARSRTRP